MYRNINLFHFRKSRAQRCMPPFHKKVYFISLIPTNSRWMNLLEKPFFTSVLLIQNHNSNCYYKQDLYYWKIHQFSRKNDFKSIPTHHSTNNWIVCHKFQLLPSLIPNICFSDIHFQGSSIRLVSCYTFISGFQPPWPPPNCPNWRTPFVVSLINSVIVCQFNLIFGSSQIAIPAYQAWPTREKNIFVACVNKQLC